MVAVLVFAVALFLAALISEYAHRSIVSTTVLFLIVGFLAGPDFLGAIDADPQSDVLSSFAQIAMFTVLFTDGMQISARDLRRGWRLPSLALGVGLPLTVLGTAALGHFVAGLAWLPAIIIGAVLAPTDPVFASAIVGRREIPARVRDLLNIESGLNDGLALPLVVGFLALATREHVSAVGMIADVVLGLAVGVGIPWLGHRIEQMKAFTVAEKYEPLLSLALGLAIYATASLTGINMFVAAFAAGVTVATLQPRFGRMFREFGELLAELLKLATVMLFGALISPRFLAGVPAAGFGFALLTLLLVRPAALQVALHRARLSGQERIVTYWFGPKGFASIVFGLFVVQSGMPEAPRMFRLIAIVVGLSIIAHSSTDVIVARWFRPGRRREPAPPRDASAPAG